MSIFFFQAVNVTDADLTLGEVIGLFPMSLNVIQSGYHNYIMFFSCFWFEV